MSDKRLILKLNSILGHIKIEDKTEKVKQVDAKVDITTLNNINEKQTIHNKQVINPRKFPITKKKYDETLKLLRNTYPRCFTFPPKPLAIGIHTELLNLQHEQLSKTTIRYFLKIYCSRREYKNVLAVGADRIDLEGNVTGRVIEEETATQRRKADNSNQYNDL